MLNVKNCVDPVSMQNKRTRDHCNIPIDRHIQEQRVRVEEREKEVPQMYQEVMRLEQILQNATGRRSIRMRRDVEVCIEKVKKQAEYIESGQHLRDYDESTIPYIEAYSKQTMAPRKKQLQFIVPGESKQHFEIQEHKNNQNEVVDEFLTNIVGEVPKARISRNDACPRCTDVDMILMTSRAILACPKCGTSSTYLDATSSSISYDETVEMVTFSYKRGNHFQDWLLNVQGQEGYEVPTDVIQAVMNELYKQRIVNINDITTQKVREVLKTLKLRRCYEHCAQIVSKCTGSPSPQLPPEASELCRLMFMAVQLPFQKYCPVYRKNFLSYSFILSKLLYILGYDELCDRLTMLKGKDKLQRMDEIWKNICRELDWEFFPSC